MQKLIKIVVAVAVAASPGVPVMAPANAHTTTYAHKHRYKGRVHYARKYCRRSPATTGKVVGGVAGAVAGPSIIGHGLLGAAVGAVGGVGRRCDRPHRDGQAPLLLPLGSRRARTCPLMPSTAGLSGRASVRLRSGRSRSSRGWSRLRCSAASRSTWRGLAKSFSG